MGRKILIGLAVIGLAVFGWSQMSVAATFSNADFSGTWSFYCDCQQKDDTFNGWVYGTMVSDGAGNLTGGTGANSLGNSIDVPEGTYTLNSDGTMTITTLTDMTIHAAMNDGKDVIAMVGTAINCGSDNHTEYNHGVAVKNQAGGFANVDFNGVWNFYASGQGVGTAGNGWVYGPITSDGAGAITAGTTLSFQDGGTDTVAADSTYTGNADGTIISTLNFTSGATVDVIGAMNDGKDVVGIVYTVKFEGVDNSYGAGVLIKNQASNFSNSDFSGTLYIYAEWQKQDSVSNGWFYGPITSDGAGNITGGTWTDEGGNSGIVTSQTYTITDSGIMTSGDNWRGAMSDSKDVIAFVNTSVDDSTEYQAGIIVNPKYTEEETTTTSSEDGGGGGGCFIATAAYGTPMAEEVKSLCKFRDEVLMKTTAGRDFVELYYKTSPPIADFIRNRPALKAMVRIGLKPLVWFSRLVK